MQGLKLRDSRAVVSIVSCALFVSVLANDVQAVNYNYEYGHGHVGLNYGINPPDPRDRIAGNSTPTDYPGLNPALDLLPHVGIPGGAGHDTNLPAGGPYGPDQVTHIVPNSTYSSRNTSAALDAALGIPASQQLWILPESQSAAASQNAPWTGPAVAPTAYSQFDDIQGDDGNPGALPNVQWTLTGVSGPGDVALWVNDAFGTPIVWMGSADGLDPVGGADTHLLGAGGAHNFWGFTEPGLYDLTFRWDVEIGGSPVTESATFAFNVVPEPSALSFLAIAGALAVMRRRCW